MAYVWIAIGGALGSVARFWFSGLVARHFGETFPWGTLLVNISGFVRYRFFCRPCRAGGTLVGFAGGAPFRNGRHLWRLYNLLFV